jgi:hypothetical protein
MYEKTKILALSNEEKKAEDEGEEEDNPEFDSENGFWRY